MVCKYLTHALNNKGSLGFTTRAMLTLQNGVIDETLQHGPSKRYLRQTSHYHVARQLAVMQSSGLQLRLPMGHEDLHGSALHRMMTCVRYDPLDLGLKCKIPTGVYKPLLDLCTDFHELCLPNKRKLTFLSTTELAQKFGKAVNSKHKLALNQAIKIINRNHLSGEDINHPSFNRIAPLSLHDRIVCNPQIRTELRCHNTEHLYSQEVNERECRALSLLHKHQREHTQQQRDKQASRRKANVSQPTRREEVMDLDTDRHPTQQSLQRRRPEREASVNDGRKTPTAEHLPARNPR